MKLYSLFAVFFFTCIYLPLASGDQLVSNLNSSKLSIPRLVNGELLIQPNYMRLKIIETTEKNNLPLVFMISGDGGWNKFTQTLATHLSKEGLGIIGLDALDYFWKARTPEEVAADVSTVIERYLKLWNKRSFVLVGYSFGADVIPFISNRFDSNLKGSLQGVLALSPDLHSDFEIRVSDLLHLESKKRYDVLAEIKKMGKMDVVAFFGSKEDLKVRNHFIENGVKVILLTGDHHFNKDYEAITTGIFKEINKKQ